MTRHSMPCARAYSSPAAPGTFDTTTRISAGSLASTSARMLLPRPEMRMASFAFVSMVGIRLATQQRQSYAETSAPLARNSLLSRHQSQRQQGADLLARKGLQRVSRGAPGRFEALPDRPP